MGRAMRYRKKRLTFRRILWDRLQSVSLGFQTDSPDRLPTWLTQAEILEQVANLSYAGGGR